LASNIDLMQVIYRHPRLEDAPAITLLVRNCGNLDANSHYAQLLLCHHFWGTCMVAEHESEVIGFVSGYRPPVEPHTVFVWQIAVAARARGAGVAGQLLVELVQRAVGGRVDFLEATITPSNLASQRLFEGFARRLGASLARMRVFSAELFQGVEPHEAEDLYRIGPLPSTTFVKE
jgi:L-2,4-diaminobutyric acid acetyltransferase